MSYLDNHTDADIHLLATAIQKMQQMLGGQRASDILNPQEHRAVREVLVGAVMEDEHETN